jgi:putative inorganic carbon (hco3(-)) transporter
MRRLFLLAMFWGSMPVILLDPFLGIVYYTLNSIIRPEQLLWGDASAVGRIFLAVQALTFLSWIINKDKLNPKNTPLPLQMKLIWFIAIGMTIVTHVSAVNPQFSWRWTEIFWKMSIFCFVISKAFNTARKVEIYYALVVIWYSLLAVWGIQQKLGGNARMEGLGGVQLPDVNFLAAVYVLHFPMTYYSMFSTKKWIKFGVGIPSFIIFVIFIMFGGSRGAFIGMAACMALIFLRTKGTQKFKMLLTLVVVGSLLILVLGQLAPKGFFDEYTARLETILGEEDEETGEVEREGSSASRLVMWKSALYIFRKHPEYWLLGVGIASYRLMYFREHRYELQDYLEPDEFLIVAYGGSGGKDLHSTYVSALMGGGLVVFLPWLFLIFYAWNQARMIPQKYPQFINGVNIHNYARALEIGIIGYCISAAFVSMELIDIFYWQLVIVGAITNLGKARLAREALGEEDEEAFEQSDPRYAQLSYH